MIAIRGQKQIPYAVVIPSRGRPDILAKTLKKMPFLDATGVFFGFEHGESAEYAARIGTLIHARTVLYDNPQGSVAVAREHLRKEVLRVNVERRPRYQYVVVTDDNASYTHESLDNLVCATDAYTEFAQRTAVVAGMHNTAPHFDRALITKKIKAHGYTTYPNVAMIFQCYPADLYARYTYPAEAYGLDDRHFYLWAISQGVRDFRVCMDAPFNKTRYQKGGQGAINERAEKCGKAIACLASDFPQYVGATGTLRIPWQFILNMVSADGGMTANRLAGGAMRKEGALHTRPAMTIKKKR